MPARTLSQRSLGKTRVQVPLIGYGRAPLGKLMVTRRHAVKCLADAVDQGITRLDALPGYRSEPHVGEVMATRRSEVFLATKINRWSNEGVLEELKKSLEKLKTDDVGLIQMHVVAAMADVELAPRRRWSRPAPRDWCATSGSPATPARSCSATH